VQKKDEQVGRRACVKGLTHCVAAALAFGWGAAAVHASSLRLLGELHGPLDAQIPKYAWVLDARVCAGGSRVGVVWTRGLDSKWLSWDEAARVWRVEGSNEVLPSGAPSKDPDGKLLSDHSYPDWADVFPPGRFAGFAVLSLEEWSSQGCTPNLAREVPVGWRTFFNIYATWTTSGVLSWAYVNGRVMLSGYAFRRASARKPTGCHKS